MDFDVQNTDTYYKPVSVSPQQFKLYEIFYEKGFI
jgi:hypothetical protein